MRRILPAILLLLPSSVFPQAVSKRSGSLTVVVDQGLVFPGGLIVAYARSLRPLRGSASAVFDGRRCPFYAEAHGLRALVPVPSTLAPGSHALGIEIRAGRRRRRIPFEILVPPRPYPPRSVVIPEAKRELLLEPGVEREGRRVLLQLRTATLSQLWRAPFRPPVDAQPVYSYGAPTDYVGGSPVESRTDAIYGEYHRGMDYEVPSGTVVQAPAAGTVLMAAPLTLTGGTLILDHGQGVVSVFFHLGRIDVREGQEVEGRAPIALSGDTGLASAPHLHWAVYVHGVAVDPRVMEGLAE